MAIPSCSHTRLPRHSKAVSPISMHTRKAIPPWPQSIVSTQVGRSDKVSLSGAYAHLFCVLRMGSSDHSLSYHFPEFLRDASLQVLSSTRALAPHGKYCDFYRGLNETPLSDFTAFSVQSFSQVFDLLTSAMMNAGCLELGDGTRITDEQERQALMKELRHFAEQGLLFLMSEWVVRRPLYARL